MHKTVQQAQARQHPSMNGGRWAQSLISSPEDILKQQPLEKRKLVFSCGILLHTLITHYNAGRPYVHD